MDIGGGKFTWSNGQEDPTLEKLDRILISSPWENLFPLTVVQKLVRKLSDHNPLLWDTMDKKEKKVQTFRFDTSWDKHPDFLNKVQQVWQTPMVATDSLGIIQEKLKKISKVFKGWGINLGGVGGGH